MKLLQLHLSDARSVVCGKISFLLS